MAPMVGVQCQERMTSERTEDLKALLAQPVDPARADVMISATRTSAIAQTSLRSGRSAVHPALPFGGNSRCRPMDKPALAGGLPER